MKRRQFLQSSAAVAAVASLPASHAIAAAVAAMVEVAGDVNAITGGWYTNEVSDQANKTVNKNYQGNYERLLKVKNHYDPTNLSRLNANVKPTV